MKTYVMSILGLAIVVGLANAETPPRMPSRPGIFDKHPRPAIIVIENEDDIFRDVVVNVRETQTGTLKLGAGVNSDCGLVGSISVSEWPTPWVARPEVLRRACEP